MNQELTPKPMRTPERYDFTYGFIRFKRKGEQILYFICKYPAGDFPNGEHPLIDRYEGVANGILKDQAHLKEFEKCKTLVQVMQIHSLGSVS